MVVISFEVECEISEQAKTALCHAVAPAGNKKGAAPVEGAACSVERETIRVALR